MSVLLAPGAIFAERYEVVRMLSQGGMGAIYEVIHRETARRRALKVMLPNLLGDDDMRARFLREARVTADVASENLVETFDAGIDAASGQPFLVMELLRGKDLEGRLRDGAVPWTEVAVLLTQVARGLDKTHAAGIVHRDLKPENLFVCAREDGSPLVKILDFGIAKVLSDSQRRKSTRSLGTPLYMAPEMLGRRTANLSGAVDRYALGHIAYTLLVGEAYFETEGREVDSVLGLLPMVAAGAAELPSVRAQRSGLSLGAAFDAWFARATHVDAAARFPTSREQIEALVNVLERERPAFAVRVPMLAIARTASPDADTLDVASALMSARSEEVGAKTAVSLGSEDRPSQLQVVSAPTLIAPAPPSRDFTVALDSQPTRKSAHGRWIIFGIAAAAAVALVIVLIVHNESPSVATRLPEPAASAELRAEAPGFHTQRPDTLVSPSGPLSLATSAVAPSAVAPSAVAPSAVAPSAVAPSAAVGSQPSGPPRPVSRPSAKPLTAPSDCAKDPSRCR